MAVTTIPKGARGVDFYALTDGIKRYILDPKNRITFVARYLDSGAKGLTQAEVDWYRDNGIGVLAIKEIRSTDTDGGAAAGAATAKRAKEQALAFGYPKGLTITMCADQDIVPGRNMDSAVAYMEAARAVLAPEYQLGGYADVDLAKEMERRGTPFVCVCIPGARAWSPKWFWQRVAAALPFGLTVHMLQGFDHPNRVDPLTVTQPFDVWLPTKAAPVPPKPEPVPPVVKPKPPAPKPTPKPPVQTRPPVKLGSTGKAVRDLQTKLKIVVDGKFGPQTEAAVKRFQTQRKIKVDGIVGPVTWALIDKLK